MKSVAMRGIECVFMGIYAAIKPRFIPDPLAVAHTARAWVLLESGFDCDQPAPNEEGMTPIQAARFHLTQAIDRLDIREARLRRGLNPATGKRRKPTLAEIAVNEDQPSTESEPSPTMPCGAGIE
jgi:hypothetical protein